MAQSLQIRLSSDTLTETEARRWVHLTQPVEDGMDKTASMFDIAQMVARARSGDSAFTYKKNECPAGINENGNLNIRLDFESWPSFPTLAYTVSSNIGQVSPPQIIEEFVEFSLVFGKTDAVELDFILKEITSLTWETECIDLEGNVLPDQPLEMDGLTTVRTEQEIFGVARVRGTKIGASHRLTTQLIKSYPVRPDTPLPEEGVDAEMLEEYWAYTDVATWNGEPVDESETVDMTGLKLENLSITITATWINTEGEEQSENMRLAIPQCIKDLLLACDGDPESFTGGSGTTVCDLGDRETHLTVYRSSCTGDVLEERRTKDDPDSWCE